MIRLRTTRGGVRDIYTSRKANRRLLGAEVPQEGDAASDDGVLHFPLAAVASETRRRDTLWLFLDASAGTSWLGATLAIFLDPMTRSIARQSLDANPSEAEHAERELAALAASFDMLPVDATATTAVPSRRGPKPSTSLLAIVVAASIFAGAFGAIVLYQLPAVHTQPGRSDLPLDAGSMRAIGDLTTKLNTPLEITRVTNDEIKRIVSEVTSALSRPSDLPLDAESMRAIGHLTTKLNTPLEITRFTDDEIKQLAGALVSAMPETAIVRARINAAVSKYTITTVDEVDEVDASQSLINDIVAAIRGK